MNIPFYVKKKGKYKEYDIFRFYTVINGIKNALLTAFPDKNDIINKAYNIIKLSLMIFKRNNKEIGVIYRKPKISLDNIKMFENVNDLTISWIHTGLSKLSPALKPFWNSNCKILSDNLWIPNNKQLISKEYNKSFTEEIEFSKENIVIEEYFESSLFEDVYNTDYFNPNLISEGTLDIQNIRCRKIRFYPNKTQQKILKGWIGTSRFIYNESLNAVKNNKEPIDFRYLRNKFVTVKNNPYVQQWMKGTPKDIRAGAIHDMVSAYKIAFTNLKRGNIFNFKLDYRRKKNEKSIVIPKYTIFIDKKKLKMFPKTFIGKIRLSNDKCLKNIKIDHDCRLGIKYNKWFLYVPLTIVGKNNTPKYNVCALDPGVRKFQTIYSNEKATKITFLKKSLINKLHRKIDFLKSIRDKNRITKNVCKIKTSDIQFKIDNLIDDLHCKTINYLSDNYKTVFIPIFESQEMVMKNKNRKCNRNMLQLKHFRFKERLIGKYSMLHDSEVIVVTEEYTSRTCGRCGFINPKSSLEIFTCRHCNLINDRDINAARNIYIKSILGI